jgi:hypothetical protein
VLSIRIPDLATEFALGHAGNTLKPSPMLVKLGIALICPLLMLLLLLLEQAIAVHLYNYTSILVVYYFSLNFALLALPSDAWARLMRVAPDLDALITDENDTYAIVTLIKRTAQLRYQITISSAAAILGIVIAAVDAQARNIPVEYAIAYELSLGMTLLLGSNVVVWMINGLRYLHAMSRLESVQFDQVDPAQAPGLQRIYSLVTRVQWYATGGLLLSILPLAIAYATTPDTRFLHAAVISASVIAFIVVVLVYLLPPRFLHVMRKRDKERLLLELRNELPPEVLDLNGLTLCDATERLALYRHIQALPTGGLDRVMVTSLFLALATVAAGFLPLLLAPSHAS